MLSFFERQKYPLLVYSLKHNVSVVEFENGHIRIRIADSIQPQFIADLVITLEETTGQHWVVDIDAGPLGITVADEELSAFARQQNDIMQYPLVQAIMAEFKGAKIESLTRQSLDSNQETTSDFNNDTTTDLIFDEET